MPVGKHVRWIPLRRGGVRAFVLVAGVLGTAAPGRAQFPSDAVPTCAVSSSTFNGWFQSGAAALGGLVMPVNSVAFDPARGNCSFFHWAERMFLWVTSPIPSGGSPFGSGAGVNPIVFDSATFYDVSPPDASGNRTLVPHPLTPVTFRFAEPRARKAGPHGLPIFKSKSGQTLELDTPRKGPSGKPLITDASGKPVGIARVRIASGGKKATLFDARGKVIALLPKASASANAGHFPRVMALNTICNLGADCGGPVGPIQGVIDVATGSIIETDTDQAQEGPGIYPVLMTQNGSLVYYSIMVNDVFVNLLAGTKAHAITPAPTRFPTTQTELNSITAFATTQGQVLSDATALAIELKAAWVDASTLPSGTIGSYITAQAMVPTYNMSANKWTPTGKTQQKTLALVGLHVVGSVAGHPEMIFATFEHFGNAPNAAYSYVSTRTGANGKNLTISVPQDSGGPWLLAAAGASGPLSGPCILVEIPGLQNPWNCPNMVENSGIITAYGALPISASNTLRLKPFGAASNTTPNNNVASPAASNSEVISVNSSLHNLMTAAGAGADPRNNYYMIGAEWAPSGEVPGSSTGLPANFYPGFTVNPNVVGTSQLFNTTMETYDQGPGTVLYQGQNTGETCFDCHGGSLAMSSLSHIFSHINVTKVPQ